ncbi:hypothetical protein EIP86_010845 [Pleurotus ostreatoroseus]|nr:hypothetical protein EIP86_010845 [Pleurotus ostreatoroseus]
MSIDLEWQTLDSSLASSLVDLLNKQLHSTNRPSFIGPIEVTSLDFGTTSPDVELVDMRDVYRDFLEDDEDEDVEPETVKVTEGAEDDEGFEWVSRKVARSRSLAEEGPAYHLLPPHFRYGHGPVSDMYASTPNLHAARGGWGPAMANLTELRPAFPHSSGYASPLYRPPFASITPRPSFPPSASPKREVTPAVTPPNKETTPIASPDPQNIPPSNPNLQLHLHIGWQSNLRVTFTTSLLINYPSPMFMSLPIKLSVTGLVFDGEIVVAYEGERKRVHLCIIDDLDPYGPLTGDRQKREPSTGNTPPEHEDDGTSHSPATARPSKPLPIGQRLLPSIYIESEIGQADKHVLKNVTRVERFIQDVIRKTVEEELVFPNFHTLVLPENQPQAQ